MTNQQQHLISFHIQTTGHQASIANVKKFERDIDASVKKMNLSDKEAKRLSGTLKKDLKGGLDSSSQGAKSLGQNLAFIMKRALITIPVWLALRGALMAVMRTITGVIGAQLDLADGLARLRTVTHGTVEEIERGMAASRRAILDAATTGNKSIKELSEMMYFLRTANLSTQESLEAFPHVLNLIVGTQTDVKEATRAVAGTWNTMAHAMDDSLSTAEKFQHITDVLAYTFATQDVEMRELTQSFTQFAPYATGLTDSFQEMVTTLGFLNTQMLRAGRTGRLTGRAILQLTKNADKLAEIFGIAFDPDAPISLLDTVRQIAGSVDNAEEITARYGEQLREVFMTRGSVAVRLLVSNIDGLNKALKDADENAEGFAEQIHRLRMRTVRAQMQRFQNILAVTANEFFTTATGGWSLSASLQNMNDRLDESREGIKATASTIRTLRLAMEELPAAAREVYSEMAGGEDELDGVILQLNTMIDLIKGIPTISALIQPSGPVEDLIGVSSIRDRLDEVIDNYGEEILDRTANATEKVRQVTSGVLDVLSLGARHWGEWLGLTESIRRALGRGKDAAKEEAKIIEDARTKRERTLKDIEDLEKTSEAGAKARLAVEKLGLEMMKERGATNIEILKADYERLKTLREQGRLDSESIEDIEARLKVMQEQAKLEKEIKDNVMRDQIRLLKVRGFSEVQIIDAKKQQLRTDMDSINRAQTLIRLAELRRQRETEVARVQHEQVNSIRDIAVAYTQAIHDDERRHELRKIAELLTYEEDELINAASTNDETMHLMIDNLQYFSKTQQNAIRKAVAQIHGFEAYAFEEETTEIQRVLEETFKDDTLATYLPGLFSKTLREEGIKAMEDIFKAVESDRLERVQRRAKELATEVAFKVDRTQFMREPVHHDTLTDKHMTSFLKHIEEKRTIPFEEIPVRFEDRLRMDLGLSIEGLSEFKESVQQEVIEEIKRTVRTELLDDTNWLELFLRRTNIK